MSKVDETPFLEPSSNIERLPAHVQKDSSAMVEWTTLPAAPQIEAGESFDPTMLFHSLRRHWLLATVLGLLLGIVITAACLLFLPKNYTATAMIRVDMNPGENPLETRINYNIRTEYETFKNTQALSVRSPFVLGVALGKPGINTLKIYQREQDNPITWLQESLVIRYPKNAEYMEISLTDNDPREVTTMVRAVVTAYMSEVVQQEENKKNTNFAELQNMEKEKSNEIRRKNEAIKQLAMHMKTIDPNPKTINLQVQAVMNEYRILRSSLSAVTTEARKAKAELITYEETFKLLEKDRVSKFELNEAVSRDIMCTQCQKQMISLKLVVEEQKRNFKSGTGSTGIRNEIYLGPYVKQYEAAEKELEERKLELEEQLYASKEYEIKHKIAELKIQNKLVISEKESVQIEFNKTEAEVEKLSKSSVELESMLDELDNLKAIFVRLSTKVKQAELGLLQPSRIHKPKETPTPESYDSPELRTALAIVAGCFSSVLPLLAIVLFDLRKKKVNTAEDITKNLGLPVMGAVPVIPSRAIRRLNAPSGPGHRWNVRLTESIDSIAAKLLRSASLDGDQIVLITSAVSGEGKTTLAVQIAMSLARVGKRTALVDFDLRRPAIDKAFQLPLDPGVSEALCGEADVRELGQSVGVDNLSVISAGQCDRHALQALANGEDERILSQLKSEYDFVIVDGSPILPVADSRYVAQHVDMVVLSVFRDLSRMPKVMSAYEILKSFGIENVEAVVASPCDAGYGVVQVAADNESGIA